jgi:hypothetical protein
MLKHVAKHNDKRAVILYREVPNEDHMCLVVYSELLPRLVHDEVMKVLESASGQQAESLADALFRNIMADGRNTLEVLHRESFIKKVPTNQIIVQANAKSTVRLDELNSILNEMKQGEQAVQRLAELDGERGMTGGKRRQNEAREVGAPANSRAIPAKHPEATLVTDFLTEGELASQRIAQAEKMKSTAAQLLAEAERLMAEAAQTTAGSKVNAKKTKVKAN